MPSQPITIRQAAMLGIPRNHLQTILINKGYPKKGAVDWLREHGYVYKDHRIEGMYRRFRQEPPIEGSTYYSKKITPDVILVFQKY